MQKKNKRKWWSTVLKIVDKSQKTQGLGLAIWRTLVTSRKSWRRGGAGVQSAGTEGNSH